MGQVTFSEIAVALVRSTKLAGCEDANQRQNQLDQQFRVHGFHLPWWCLALSVCHSANVIDGRDSSVIVSWLSTPRAKKLLGSTNYRDFRRLGLAGLASRWPRLRGPRVFASSSTESTATFQARSPDFHPSSSPEPSLRRIQPSLQPARPAASATVNHSLSGDATIMHRMVTPPATPSNEVPSAISIVSRSGNFVH